MSTRKSSRSDEPERPASRWRVHAWYTLRRQNPTVAARDVVPTVDQRFDIVHHAESERHGHDIRARLLANDAWVPTGAIEWGVEEPWQPY